ncbi:hypothetical protein AHAS_Ahas12G0025700 [Arachis hypogaea]
MPKGTGKLKQLHILSKFVVGKQEDNRMEELGGLLNLHGSLEIENLENVIDGNEARSARIIDKKNIEELLLKWYVSSGDDMVSNTHTDEQDILQGLQPNRVLKVLEIDGYKGCRNICRWPEGGLPPNLKELRVGGCEEHVRGLSWMGNLDNLTHLTISGFGCESIKSYPEVGSLPRLPSLTTLHIQDFDNLETLECNELLRLTSLQQLHISYCKRLKNMEGENLPPSLLLLKIYDCGLLGEHCKNKHQQIWPRISHIATIEVDDDQIF